MITIYKKTNSYDSANEKEREIEIRGLSTDEKPLIEDFAELNNGAVFVEIDTGKIFMYDKENDEWKEI